MQIISLKCTNCGGDLKIGPDVEHFACGYCGTSQVVHREGGIITLKSLEAAVAKVQLGTDRAAAELAVRRLKDELEDVNKEIRKIVRASILEKEQSQGFLGKAAVVVGLIPFFWIMYYSPITSVIWGLVVVTITAYLIRQSRGRIDGKYQFKLNPLFDRETLLKRRLAEQMRIIEN